MAKRLRNRATAVVVRGRTVLLVRDRGRRQFSLPGGGIHRGEPAISAAARELYEETRLSAYMMEHAFDYRGATQHHRVFLVLANGSVHMDRKELDGHTWWDGLDDTPVSDHVSEIVQKLRGSNHEIMGEWA